MVNEPKASKSLMQLPDGARERIESARLRLEESNDFDLRPQHRIEIYRALGPSHIPADRPPRYERWSEERLPNRTHADLVRARLALLTAQKVVPFWQIACEETDRNFATDEDRQQEEARLAVDYLRQRRERSIEEISVYTVPRAFIPSHIMEMAELALWGEIRSFEAFASEANKWWEIYPRPEEMERECFIKWATQEALYETLGWNRYFYDSSRESKPNVGMDHLDAPAGSALLAYAGIFDEAQFRLDNDKRREFWRWWLEEAILLAWRGE